MNWTRKQLAGSFLFRSMWSGTLPVLCVVWLCVVHCVRADPQVQHGEEEEVLDHPAWVTFFDQAEAMQTGDAERWLATHEPTDIPEELEGRQNIAAWIEGFHKLKRVGGRRFGNEGLQTLFGGIQGMLPWPEHVAKFNTDMAEIEVVDEGRVLIGDIPYIALEGRWVQAAPTLAEVEKLRAENPHFMKNSQPMGRSGRMALKAVALIEAQRYGSAKAVLAAVELSEVDVAQAPGPDEVHALPEPVVVDRSTPASVLRGFYEAQAVGDMDAMRGLLTPDTDERIMEILAMEAKTKRAAQALGEARRRLTHRFNEDDGARLRELLGTRHGSRNDFERGWRRAPQVPAPAKGQTLMRIELKGNRGGPFGASTEFKLGDDGWRLVGTIPADVTDELFETHKQMKMDELARIERNRRVLETMTADDAVEALLQIREAQ